MQGLSQEPAGRQTTDTQHDTCPSTGGAPETWALATRRPGQSTGGHGHGARGRHATAQGTALPQVRQAPCGPRRMRPRPYRPLMSWQPQWGRGDLLLGTDGTSLPLLPKPQAGSLTSTGDGSHTHLSPGCQTAWADPKQVAVGRSLLDPPRFWNKE